MFRLANDSLEPTWSVHGHRLQDTNLGLAKRLSSPQLGGALVPSRRRSISKASLMNRTAATLPHKSHHNRFSPTSKRELCGHSSVWWGDHSLLKDVGRPYTIAQELLWHLLGKLIDGFPPRAMHGYNIFRAYLLHRLNSRLNDGLKNWPRKMEPAQNCMHRVRAFRFLGLFHRIDDPRVRTSTDDYQPFALDRYPLVIAEWAQWPSIFASAQGKPLSKSVTRSTSPVTSTRPEANVEASLAL
jgi:hypothetical protein